MVKTTFFAFITLIFAAPAFAQYNETIRSARPGQSFGPFTTGTQIFQVQTGVNFNEFSHENLPDEGNGFNYLLSLRYGVTETMEIRSAFKINRDEISQGNGEMTLSGLSAWIVGVRFNFLDNAGSRKPSLGFQADVNLNARSDDFDTNNPEPRLLLIHGQKLNDWLGLTTNWGIRWNGNNSNTTGFYTFSLSFPVSASISGFIENYGQLSNGDLDTRFDTGFGYLVTSDLLLDLSVGYGKNDGLKDYFLDFGVSWRTGR